jgi:hypothetical protein
MTEPGSEPRIRVGVGLVEFAPFSAERRELIRRESEREAERDRKAAELAAELRSDRDIERNAELLRQGRVPRTQEQFLADVSFAQDRADAAERRREEAHADFFGKPRPSTWRKELADRKAAREEREEAEKTTPASAAEVKGLKQQIGNAI